MFKVFNAFQLVTAFAAGPFIINWLNTAEFVGAAAAFWVAIAVYIVMFFGNVACIANDIDKF